MSDHDSTTQIIQRRIRHWKTTVAGVAAIVCPIIAPFLPPEWSRKVLEVALFLSGGALLAANDPSKGKVADVVKTITGKLPLPFLCAALALAVCPACSSFRSVQTETASDGTVRQTTIKTRTFFDGKSDLAKLRASTTDKVQGMTIGSLGQESSGTNVVSLIDSVVGAAVRAAIKP